jgi:hypothetical protein
LPSPEGITNPLPKQNCDTSDAAAAGFPEPEKETVIDK